MRLRIISPAHVCVCVCVASSIIHKFICVSSASGPATLQCCPLAKWDYVSPPTINVRAAERTSLIMLCLSIRALKGKRLELSKPESLLGRYRLVHGRHLSRCEKVKGQLRVRFKMNERRYRGLHIDMKLIGYHSNVPCATTKRMSV